MNRPLGQFSLYVAMSVTVSVPSWKPHFPVDWRIMVVERIANIGIPLAIFFFFRSYDFLHFRKILVLGSLQTSLLWIVLKLAGGEFCGPGCWRWCQVTGDTLHLTRDTIHVKIILNLCKNFFCKCFDIDPLICLTFVYRAVSFIGPCHYTRQNWSEA